MNFGLTCSIAMLYFVICIFVEIYLPNSKRGEKGLTLKLHEIGLKLTFVDSVALPISVISSCLEAACHHYGFTCITIKKILKFVFNSTVKYKALGSVQFLFWEAPVLWKKRKEAVRVNIPT